MIKNTPFLGYLGNTPLHYAVLAKDVERVKLLISRKCDINASNNSGKE